MKKPHFEFILHMFPDLKGRQYLNKPDYSQIGILERFRQLRKYLKTMPVVNDKGTFEYDPNILAYWYMFAAEQCQIFKMAREFSEELDKVDLDVKCIMIPVSEKMICIEFPEHMRFDLGGKKYARCCYAYVTDERASTTDGILAKHYFEMVFPLYDEDDNLTQEVHQFGLPITDLHATFSEMLEQCHDRELKSEKVQKILRENPFAKVHFNRELFSFVLKSYLYIHSGDPDLRQYLPPRPPTTTKPKKVRLWYRAHENHSMVNMVLVGFNFKKPIVYRVGSSSVCGHFRWQPYGPAREKVKLIWIDPHERHYNNEVVADESI